MFVCIDVALSIQSVLFTNSRIKLREFAAVSGVLHVARRQPRIRCVHAVDKNDPASISSIDFACSLASLVHAPTPNCVPFAIRITKLFEFFRFHLK